MTDRVALVQRLRRHLARDEERDAEYFRGLGEATRLRTLETLADEGELTVGELVARLGQPHDPSRRSGIVAARPPTR